MSELKKLEEILIKFRDERSWKKFHNPREYFKKHVEINKRY